MAQYENGKWHRQRQQPASLPVYRNQDDFSRHELRQHIRLEPNDSQSLFGIRPIIEVSVTGARYSPFINMIDGTILRPEARSGSYDTYDYQVVSDLNTESPQRSEQAPNLIRLELLLDIPDDLAAKFRKIAEPVIADVKAEGAKGVEEKARRLEAFLRDSGEFGYTLQMEVENPALDPVEDFLVNRKEGHCEYFASALALLLRSINIPSRVVNGFKGGDWNDVTKAMYVRRKHAHSWVEAYTGSPDGRLANWITLDATPGLEREKSVAEVGGFSSNFRTATDTVRHVWVFYILGFDADRQNKLIYGPIRQLMSEVVKGYHLLEDAVRDSLGSLFRFENLGSMISIKGFFVSFILLTTLVLGIRLIIWIAKWLLRMFSDSESDSVGVVPGIIFYKRLTQTLSKYDINREQAETQREFARRASLFLSARDPGTISVSEVPDMIVEAFYRVRFGHLDLSPDTLRELESRLDTLEESLKSDQV